MKARFFSSDGEITPRTSTSSFKKHEASKFSSSSLWEGFGFLGKESSVALRNCDLKRERRGTHSCQLHSYFEIIQVHNSLILEMRSIGTIFGILVLGFATWHSGIVNSAVIVQNGNEVPPPLNNAQPDDDINRNIKIFQEVIGDYAELSNAYLAPARDETVREKRTLGVIRTIANRTISGFQSIRSLFSGGLSGSGSGGGGFRTFFSNLLNRVLIFLTNLWDRITGFFRRDGSSGGGLFSRLGKLFRGSGGGGGGGLFSIFRPTTTTEASYADSDFNYYSSSTTSTEKPDEVEGNDGNNNVIGEAKEKKGKSLDDTESDKTADAGSSSDDFIPFPGDSDLNSRSGKKLEREIENPVAVGVKADEKPSAPHVVNSPSIIHLIDDGRRFV